MDSACGVDTSAKRAYVRNFSAGMALYVVAILAASFIIKNYGEMLPFWSKLLLTLSPVPPVVWAGVAIIRHVRSMDEMQRQMRFEAAVFSLLLVGFGSFTYGLMQDFLGLPTFSMVWVLPAISAAYGIGELITRRRYG